MLRLMVTGADGFVGRRLVNRVVRERPSWTLIPFAGPAEAGGFDIRDSEAVYSAVRKSKPTHVLHLAAMSSVVEATANPISAFESNVHGVLNLILAMEANAPDAFLLFVSSAEVYGRSFQSGAPLDETALLQPANFYAVTKAAADQMVQQASYDRLSAAVARPFNHIGAGQSTTFAISSFARQIAEIEQGLRAPILRVGDLGSSRDFLDVDDVIDAYLLLIEQSVDRLVERVFNIASGTSRTVGEILAELLRLSEREIDIEVAPDRLRGSPPIQHKAANNRIISVGWQQKTPISQTLLAVLNAHREAVHALTL